MTNPTVPAYALPSNLQLAQEIVDSEPVIGVYAACEWDELHDDGKLWISAIVAEARRRLAEQPATSFQFSSNLRPAPFALTPPVVGCVLSGSASGVGVTEVPVLPVKLVDQPKRSEDPRLSRANDDQPIPPTIPEDGGEEPERVAPPQASLSAPVEFTTPRPAGADPFGTNDTSEPVSPSPSTSDAAPEPQADRLSKIRAAAQALAKKHSTDRVTRPALGHRTERKTSALPEMPTEARRKKLEGAISHLKRLGILVSVCDREALVRQYRVTGKRDKHLADDVVAYALQRGFEPDHG